MIIVREVGIIETWFSPKRFKEEDPEYLRTSFFKLTRVVNGRVKIYHRKIGPAASSSGYHSYNDWIVHNVGGRSDGPANISYKINGPYSEWEFKGVECTEEIYWNM